MVVALFFLFLSQLSPFSTPSFEAVIGIFDSLLSDPSRADLHAQVRDVLGKVYAVVLFAASPSEELSVCVCVFACDLLLISFSGTARLLRTVFSPPPRIASAPTRLLLPISRRRRDKRHQPRHLPKNPSARAIPTRPRAARSRAARTIAGRRGMTSGP